MSNKGEAAAFRSEVLLLLHEAGFHSARRPPEPKNVAAADKVHGDIIGLPITVAVRSSQTLDLSGALNEAKREAHAEGLDHYISIQRRRAMHGKTHDGLDSFVTTDLRTMLSLLAQLHPEAVTTQSSLATGASRAEARLGAADPQGPVTARPVDRPGLGAARASGRASRQETKKHGDSAGTRGPQIGRI